MKFLSEIQINFMQNVGFFSPELHMYFFVGFASVEFWQMSEEKTRQYHLHLLDKNNSYWTMF